jgi:hypothetical protein
MRNLDIPMRMTVEFVSQMGGVTAWRPVKAEMKSFEGSPHAKTACPKAMKPKVTESSAPLKRDAKARMRQTVKRTVSNEDVHMQEMSFMAKMTFSIEK